MWIWLRKLRSSKLEVYIASLAVIVIHPALWPGVVLLDLIYTAGNVLEHKYSAQKSAAQADLVRAQAELAQAKK